MLMCTHHATTTTAVEERLSFDDLCSMSDPSIVKRMGAMREGGLISPDADLSDADLKFCCSIIRKLDLTGLDGKRNKERCDVDSEPALDLPVLALLVRLCHCLGIDPCAHLPVHAGLSLLRANATHPHEPRCDTARTNGLSSISKKRCREHDEDDSTGKRWSEPSRNALSQPSATTASAAHPLSSSFSRYRVDRSPEPAQSPSASRLILSLADIPAYSIFGPGYDLEWEADVETHSSSLTVTSRRYDFSASEQSKSEYSECESFSTVYTSLWGV